MDRPVFHLTLEALPREGRSGEPIPAEVRLRLALKTLWRAFGLRCRDCRTVEPEPEEEPTAKGG
jgi:hypothetical protein